MFNDMIVDVGKWLTAYSWSLKTSGLGMKHLQDTMNRNLDAMLTRGESLEALMQKSKDLWLGVVNNDPCVAIRNDWELDLGTFTQNGQAFLVSE
jgi:hypothetical protein